MGFDTAGRKLPGDPDRTIAAVSIAFARFLGILVPSVAESNYLSAPVRIGSSSYAFSVFDPPSLLAL